MAGNQPTIERISEIAAIVAADQNVEVVHAEIRGSKRDSVVRIYIDKEGGVGIDDCSRFSTAVESVLDAEELIPWAYVLEVSSPGIERELYSLADFAKFAGQLAKVKSSVEINGQKTFVGLIEAVEDSDIVLSDRNLGDVRIPWSSVAKANLKMDLGKELKGR